MNTSLKWIKALVPGLDCGVQEYVDAMTLSGSKVEGYEQLDLSLIHIQYYKWTQWIFLKLFKAGLAYKKEMPINWCTS